MDTPKKKRPLRSTPGLRSASSTSSRAVAASAATVPPADFKRTSVSWIETLQAAAIVVVRAISAELAGDKTPKPALRAMKALLKETRSGLLSAKEGDARIEDADVVMALQDIYAAIGDDRALHWEGERGGLELFVFPWRKHTKQEDAIAEVFALDKEVDTKTIKSLVRTKAQLAIPAIPNETGTTGPKEHALAAVRKMRNAPSRSTFFGMKKGAGPRRAEERDEFRRWLYRHTKDELREFVDLVTAPPLNEDLDRMSPDDLVPQRRRRLVGTPEHGSKPEREPTTPKSKRERRR